MGNKIMFVLMWEGKVVWPFPQNMSALS